MGKDNFFKIKKDVPKKEKRTIFVPKTEKDLDDVLNKMCEGEKAKNDLSKTVAVNGNEKIDLISGEVYTPIDLKSPVPVEKKITDTKKESQKPGKTFFYKKEPIVSRIPKVAIRSDITVVCIELTYSLEEIQKLLNATKMNLDTKFFKIIFFSNNIYSTEIEFTSNFSIEKLMGFVKAKKELTEIINTYDILLYDSLEEAMSFYKEKPFVGERKFKVFDDEFIITNRKYLFIISGEESGSVISKLEIQKLLMEVRMEDVDLQVILTNIDKLAKISSLGFRTIRTIKL